MRAALVIVLIVIVAFAATIIFAAFNSGQGSSSCPAPGGSDPDDFENWSCDSGLAGALAERAPGVKLNKPTVELTGGTDEREIAVDPDEAGTRIAHIEVKSGAVALVEFACKPSDDSEECKPQAACVCTPGAVIPDLIARARCTARGVAKKFADGKCNNPRASFVIPRRTVVLKFVPLAGPVTLDVK